MTNDKCLPAGQAGQMKEYRVIGLTGPMGAGKDTVAGILHRQGAEIIDVDKLAHTLYIPQSLLWQELVKAFGSKILKRGGEINRRKLGAMVFRDRRKIEILDQIIHPALKETVKRELESRELEIRKLVERVGTGLVPVRKNPIVINAALLKEIGLIDLVDEVWVVMAPQSIRLKRLMKKGMDKKTALLRMRRQMGQKEYLKMADKVIWNNKLTPSVPLS